MKYIRTPFAIFEVVEETELVYRVKAKGNPYNIYSKSKCQTEVIKPADNIEDLLDGFIIENKDCHNWFFMDVSEFKERHETLINWTYTGFIKTPNGFTYVAKLNKNGELELC